MSTGLTADDLELPIKRTEGETLEERLTGNAYHNILPARYLRKDADGDVVEAPEDLFERVAKNIALADAVFEADARGIEVTVTPDQLKPDHPRRDELAAEVFGKGTTVDDDAETTLSEYNVNKFAYETVVPELPDELRDAVAETRDEFQELMESLSFMPNSPTLMNAGDELQQLSACFVDSPADDITDIHQTAKEAAEVFQCLTADARVHVEGKGVVSVADVEPGDAVRQRDGRDHRFRNVDEVHAYDDAPVYRVTTGAGVELTGTPNHRLLADGEWTRIDELRPGDALSVRLGWLPNEDTTGDLTPVATGGQWSEARTVPNDELLALYAEGLSDYEVAERLDCSASTVQRRRANELGLAPNGSGGRERGSVAFDTGEFEHLYEAGHSDAEVAAELGVSAGTVGQYRSRNELEPNGQPVKTVSQPTELTEDLAELVGMWVGDGSEHGDGIRFHLRREETLEHADRLCRDLFEEGLDWRWEDGCYDAVLHSREIKRWWLANFGDAKPTSTDASVPRQVWRADHATVGAFCRGLFSTDGSLQKGRYPRLWSASEALVDEVQQLLIGVGIPAARWEIDSDDRDYFSVGPTSEVGLTRFGDLVGFVDGRDEELAATLADAEFRGTTFGTVRDGTWELPVESVEEAGDATVYDLTVAGTHEYVADGVVSHNSGGGMGYAFWKLRPYGDPVGSTGGIASGPITFMRTYDQMCFVPGTKVLTPDGQTPIEDLRTGQLVVDENGDSRPVTETMERFVDEEIVEITPERINKPIRVTAEHPFKVARDGGFEWVDAGDLAEDDLLVLGQSTSENGLSLGGTIDLSEIASGPLVFSDGGVRVNRDYYGASKGSAPEPFEQEVPTEAFATVAGWYLAEGSIRYQRGIPSTVTFTLNSDERPAADEIRRALESFGVPSRLRTVEDRNTLHVHVEHASFAQFVEGTFGTGAAEKQVPQGLWRAPTPVQARVLECLFAGDGMLEKRGKSQRVQLKLANEEIVDFVFQVGVRCGAQFSRHDRTPEDRQPTYSASMSVSSAIGTPLDCLFDELPDDFSPRDRTKQAHGREVVGVSSIERSEYSGPVYNAEVEGTHTYVAEDLVVHNCETIAQGGARRGAQMGVMRVSHPDVIQFIHAKNKDVSLAHSLRLNDPDDFTHTSFAEALEEARELIDDEGRVPEHLRNAVEGHLSNFNISVGVTDGFMEALYADEEFTFTNPRTGEPHVATPQTKEIYEMFDLGHHVEVGEELSVPAAELWEHIVEGAHENGEPGVIYLERVNKQHSFDVEEHPDHEILATNPCVTGETVVRLADGSERSLRELAESGEDVEVVCRDSTELSGTTAVGFDARLTREDADVVRVQTEAGPSLVCTPDHEVYTPDGYVAAEDLSPGDTVVGTREPDSRSWPVADTLTVAYTESAGTADVYNVTVEDHHNYLARTEGDDGFVNVANCGEQPLEEYEACNLGHINLSTLAALDAPDWRVWYDEHESDYDTTADAVDAFLQEAIDWDEFDHRIEYGTRFLENVVTMSDFPVPEIEEKVRRMRKIGLGVMGLAQLYIQLGIQYGTEPGHEVARQLMRHINHGSKRVSRELAEDRGSFADWDDSKYADPTRYREWFEHHTGEDADDWADGYPIRNHNTTTIAPTGCVAEDSLVSTDSGLHEIGTLDGTTAEFEQWDDLDIGVTTDGGTKRATAVYDNGFDAVKQLRTAGGFRVTSTFGHRFRTITEDGGYQWKEAREFEPGDRIVLQRGTFDGGDRPSLDTSERDSYHGNTSDELTLPEEMTPELAEFLGYYMGDGYVHEDVGVKLVVESTASELDGHLRELGRSVFGVDPTVEDKDTRHILSFGGRHLPRFFEDNGWTKDDGNDGTGAASAFVPEAILGADEACAKAFLRGLFEADGCASRKVELSTVSGTLADQVQTLLLALGCVFVRDELPMNDRDDHFGDRPRHTLRGANRREDVRFLDEIGFVTKSVDCELTAQSYKNDTYPPALVERLRALDGYSDVSPEVKHRVNQSPINGSLSRKTVRDVERQTGETLTLDGRPLTQFYVATIESVEDGRAYTKDISVPSNNTYVANGFVTHNTTSMIGNTTGGCEPIYNVAYYKNVSDDVQGDEMLVEFDDYFLRALEANGIDVEAVKREAEEQMAANEFDGVGSLSTVPDALSELFVVTGDLSGKQHAAVQCASQEGVDSAISKCIEEGTLVQTDQGLIAIEAFSDNDEPGTFSDVDGEFTIDGYEITSHYYAGSKPSTRIRLDSGAELVGATESHRVLTPDGWTLLSELEAGDIVLGDFAVSHSDGGKPVDWESDLRTSANDVAVPERMSRPFAEFLGMIAADGGAYEETGRVEITTDQMPVEDRFADLCAELFDEQVRVEYDDRTENVRRVYVTSRDLARCVRELVGHGAYEKTVPEQIVRGNAEEKLAFVKGLTLDGYNSSNGFTVYAGMSEELAYLTAQLLRSFGVPKVYEGQQWVSESEAYSHQVTVSNELQDIVSAIEPHKNPEPQFVRYKVPVDESQLSLDSYETGTKEYYAARSARNRGNPYLFDETADKLGLDYSGIAYEVTDVEDVGERELYDIEVESSHEYLVNGIVSHNTCNFPNSASVEDMDEVYRYIYDHGGKGVTVYRDGTRSKQVLTTRAKNTEFADDAEAAEAIVEQIHDVFGGLEGFLDNEAVRARLDAELADVVTGADADYADKQPRPDVLNGVTQRVDTGYGKLYVTINEDRERERPFELFANIGNSGGFTASFTEALAKTISTALRSGVDPDEIANELKGIRSPKVAWDKGEQINSIPDAIGTAMRRYLDDEIDKPYPQQQRLSESVDEARTGDRSTDGGAAVEQPDGTTGPDVDDAESSANPALDPDPDPALDPDPAPGADADDATQELIEAGESPECPECGALSLYYSEGCKTCQECGWSEC
jgi:ribonucleotide reductase alpha subunit